MIGPDAYPPADAEGNESPLGVGSRLCTQCGLCCTGALHNYAVLEPAEIPVARSQGLIIRMEERPGFSLPCPRLVNGVCSIYKTRPRVCSGYKCQVLLQNVEAGTTKFEPAIEEGR